MLAASALAGVLALAHRLKPMLQAKARATQGGSLTVLDEAWHFWTAAAF
jgi:hypothetical protein